MTCPLSEPLSELTQRLEARGYVKEIHVVDAMWAKSLLAECTKLRLPRRLRHDRLPAQEAQPGLLDLPPLLPLDRSLDGVRLRVCVTANRYGGLMPRISEFYGIVIAMYFSDHPTPHFHAAYGEHEAKLAIRPFALLEGSLPTR